MEKFIGILKSVLNFLGKAAKEGIFEKNYA